MPSRTTGLPDTPGKLQWKQRRLSVCHARLTGRQLKCFKPSSDCTIIFFLFFVVIVSDFAIIGWSFFRPDLITRQKRLQRRRYWGLITGSKNLSTGLQFDLNIFSLMFHPIYSCPQWNDPWSLVITQPNRLIISLPHTLCLSRQPTSRLTFCTLNATLDFLHKCFFYVTVSVYQQDIGLMCATSMFR